MIRISLVGDCEATLHLHPVIAWLLGLPRERAVERYTVLSGRHAWAYLSGEIVPEWVERMIDSEQRKQAAGRRIAELRRGVYP